MLSMRVRWRALQILVGGATAALIVNLLVDLLFTAHFPERVLFHTAAPGWVLTTTGQTIGLTTLIFLLPCLSWGLALFVGGSLANVLSSLFWNGAPDYLYYHNHVINSSDLTIFSGEVVIVVTLCLLLRAAWRDYRRSRLGLDSLQP